MASTSNDALGKRVTSELPAIKAELPIYHPSMQIMLAILCVAWASALAFAGTSSAVTKASVDSKGWAHIITADGRDHLIRSKKWQAGGRYTSVQVAADGRTVGWLADQMISPLQCGTNYPCPVALSLKIWRNGRVMRTYNVDGTPIRDWRFVGSGAEVAFHQASLHGPDDFDCTLFDVSTGKKLAHWAVDRKKYTAPDWVKQLLVNDPLPGPDEISNWFPDGPTPVGAGGAQPCDDVEHFDFRNAMVPIASKDEGGAPGPDVLHLQDGIGFLSDNPNSPKSQDWRLELLVDRLEHPDPLTSIRVIVLDKDHLTGTGDWRFVLAFGCANGALARLLQYDSEGVTLKHLNDQTLQLYQAIWAATDAHCCPSEHLEVLYEWNSRKHRYGRVSAFTGEGYAPMPDEK